MAVALAGPGLFVVVDVQNEQSVFKLGLSVLCVLRTVNRIACAAVCYGHWQLDDTGALDKKDRRQHGAVNAHRCVELSSLAELVLLFF